MAEFARSIGARNLAMLVAYFDESGTHGNSRIVSVTGFIGSAIEWGRIEKPWRKRLGAIKCFHATDCASQDEEFQHLDSTEANALSLDLAEILAARKLAPISGAMYRDDWRYAASPKMKQEFGDDPFIFCCAMAIQEVCDWSEEFEGGEPVAFIFAKQDQWNQLMAKVAQAFDSVPSGKYRGHVGFSTPECLIQLQAADLFAYEIYRELDFQLDNPGLSAPKRENMRVLARKLTMNYCHHFNVAQLFEFANKRDAAG